MTPLTPHFILFLLFFFGQVVVSCSSCKNPKATTTSKQAATIPQEKNKKKNHTLGHADEQEVAKIKELIASGGDVNQPVGGERKTLLAKAAHHGYI